MSALAEAFAWEQVRQRAPDRYDELRREASTRGLLAAAVIDRITENPNWPGSPPWHVARRITL